jgi:hypothetical protein
VKLADSQQELAREDGICKLDCRKKPDERVPISDRQSASIPRYSTVDWINALIVNCPCDACKYSKGEISIYQPID